MFGKPKGQLIFGDALYFRSSDRFKNIVSNMKNPYERKTKVLRAISICVLYGYYDYAQELFDTFQEVFDNDEITTFRREIIRSCIPIRRIPDFRGRKRLLNILKKMTRYLDNKRRSWAYSGKLGNR